MRFTSFSAAILGCALITSASAEKGELHHLGDRHFVCKKGDLRLHGDRGSKLYSAGKREKIRIPTKTGILSYTCRYVRSIVTCPINTTMVTLRRGIYPGKFDVECFGVPLVGMPGIGGAETDAPDETSAEPAP
jgi:hypothetical protein